MPGAPTTRPPSRYASPSKPLQFADLFDCGTGRILGLAEPQDAQNEQHPLCLLNPALGSSVSEDFLIGRRFFHGLNSIQEFFDEFVGKA
jgi:hypothetical protein